METLRFDYRPKLWSSLLIAAFFAACAAVIAIAARNNDRGLILNGLIELDTRDASIFYWGLALASAGLAAVGILSVVRSMGAPHVVVLDRDAITGPKNVMGRTTVTIPYRRITDLKVVQIKSQRILTIHHTDGKLSLSRGMLPTHEDFELIVDALAARCLASTPR